MEFNDRVLKCNDCGAEFVFTAGEQLFFHDKQFKNDPKHCKQCKAKRVRGGPRVRSETRTTCSECGAETTVPFKPTQGRPVLCRSCFQKQTVQGAAAVAVPATDATAPDVPVPDVLMPEMPAQTVEPPSLGDALLGPEPIPELG
jgi:CxxC-x17-CxxC domain-containing protein